MAEKEVADYIKVQKSLGVSDAAIRKSLIDAGYTENEFVHLLDEHKKHQKQEWITTKHILFLNVLIVVFFCILFLNLNHTYSKKLSEFSLAEDKRMTDLSTDLSTQLETLRSQMDSNQRSLSADIQSASAKVDSSKSQLDQKIAEYGYQSLSRDAALSDSIQKMSNRSLTELSGFQKELAGFKETSADFSKVIPNALNAVVTIGKKGAGIFTTTGSGVFINSDGYIVTNQHVIDKLSTISVRTHSDNDYTATVIGKSDKFDIAVLKVVSERKDFKYLDWADSDKVKVGAPVIAVGNPVGFESTVTQGIISNTRRLVNDDGIYYFQTDVAINAGNSGGPLIDTDGRIVGIATLKYARAGFEGLSFALRANDIRGVVMNIMQPQIK